MAKRKVSMGQMEPCAVEDCENGGRRQICYVCDKYHYHGRVHYPQNAASRERWGSTLTFRDGDWFRMCDAHMDVLIQERQERLME